jgi:hypothetical protein
MAQVAGSPQGCLLTDSLCYMIAQLHDIVRLNHSRHRSYPGTCSHTDTKHPCRACYGGQLSVAELVILHGGRIAINVLVLVSPEI